MPMGLPCSAVSKPRLDPMMAAVAACMTVTSRGNSYVDTFTHNKSGIAFQEFQMFTYIMSCIDTFTPNKSAIAYFLPRVLGNYFLLGFSFLCCQESLLQPMLGGPALLCVSRCRLLRLFRPTCRMKRTPFCGNWHPCTSLGTTCTKPLSARQDVP
jgi:hypothetical protein